MGICVGKPHQHKHSEKNKKKSDRKGDAQEAVTTELECPAGMPIKSERKSTEFKACRDLTGIGLQKIEALGEFLGYDSVAVETIKNNFQKVISAALDFQLKSTPHFPSYINDDHSAYEFSFAMTPVKRALRILVEPQGHEGTLKGLRDQSERFMETFRTWDAKVDLSVYDALKELFLPAEPEGRFVFWLGADFDGKGQPMYKIYFYPPCCKSETPASVMVTKAFEKLGLHMSAWEPVQKLLDSFGDRIEIEWLALDLISVEQSRTKVYLRFHDATPDELEQAARIAGGYETDEVKQLCEHFCSGVARFQGLPSKDITCGCIITYVFSRQDTERPSGFKFHLPFRHYAQNDQQIYEQVTQFMNNIGLQQYSNAYPKLIRDMCIHRDPAARTGTQTVVSYSKKIGQPELTVYMSPEIFAPERWNDALVPVS